MRVPCYFENPRGKEGTKVFREKSLAETEGGKDGEGLTMVMNK